MDKNLPDIDRLFLNSLEHHAEEPSAKVWSDVENELNKQDAEKYKKRFHNTRRLAVAALILFMLGTAGVLVQENYITKQKAVSETQAIKNEAIQNDDKKEENNVVDQNKITPQNKKKFDAKGSEILNQTPTYSSVINNNSITKTNPPVDETAVNIAQNNNENNVSSQSQNEVINSQITPGPSTSKTSPNTITAQVTPSAATANSIKDTIANVSLKTTKTKAATKTTNRGFYITPFVSYDVTSARSKDEYLYDNQGESEISKREDADISYSFGINAEYVFANRFSLQSGLSFSNLNNKISPTVVNAVKDNTGAYKFKLLTNFGFAEIKNIGVSNPQSGDSINVNSASLSLHYMSIPITAKYVVKPGKFNIAAVAGVGLNKITGEHTEVSYVSNGSYVEKSNKIEGLKRNFLTLIAGAELNYEIKKNMSVGFIPVVRYALTPVTQNAPVKTFPVNFGAGLSLKIKL